MSTNSSSSLSEGALMVVSEMSLSVLAIVLNLAVLISVRERESLLNSTTNVLLANISLANLVSAVFVKSIAVIYNGYAVASQVWQVRLAFCTLHTLTFRATWAAFPFTLLAIAYHQLALRMADNDDNEDNEDNEDDDDEQSKEPEVGKGPTPTSLGATSTSPEQFALLSVDTVRTRSKQTSFESQKSLASTEERKDDDDNNNNDDNDNDDDDDDEDDDDYAEGLNGHQKGMLTSVWALSLVYATLSDQVLSKERTAVTSCPLRHSLSLKFNLISLVLALLLPLFILIVVCPLAHLVLRLTTRCSLGSAERSTARAATESDPVMQSSLVLVFVLFYPLHMLLSELLIREDEFFVFMISKYCVGCSHLVLVPIVTLATMKDIRAAAIDVALKRHQHHGAALAHPRRLAQHPQRQEEQVGHV